MAEEGIETAVTPETAVEEGATPSSGTVIKITDFDGYNGNTLNEQVDSMIEEHGCVAIVKEYCPFCIDVLEFLTTEIGTRVYVVEVNSHPEGEKIFKHVKAKTKHPTVPMVFIKGSFIGGCDDVKALHATNELEDLLGSLIVKQKTTGTKKLETAMLVPVRRGQAQNPPFWFPNVVNNFVVRITGFQVFCLSIISMVFYNETWARYLAPGLLVDFCLRMLAGSSVSPLGMIATVVAAPFRPQFRPGPPKQFAALCGIMFTCLATIFYFVEFDGHEIVAVVILGMLAVAAGLEAFFDFCLGCLFFGWGIEYKVFPDSVYRIYTSSKQETEDSWDYMFRDSGAPEPEKVDTDPTSVISLKYKKKTDEYTKDDFNVVRNMSVGYFAMPLAIVGLATAFKMASNWNEEFRGLLQDEESLASFQVMQETWFQVIAIFAAAVFIAMFILYGYRLFLYTHKCTTEWDCPLRSPSFGTITICFMLFGFLVYDQIEESEVPEEGTPRKFARVIFWMGAVAHVLLTIAKMAEWIGNRLEMEHVHAQWMIFPVGLSVAALCASIIPMFAEEATNDDNHVEANTLVARFFFSFAVLMWVTLFVISFLKVVTTHNSDNRIRHGVFIWIAAPCVVGLAQASICLREAQQGFRTTGECQADFANFYFIGMFFFLMFVWATFPYIGFFGKDKFGMSYWIECFALDALAACSAFFYALNGFNASKTLMLIGLSVASIANLTAFCHTMVALIRRRGVFTPEVKWGPLSFMKLTHEAFRGNMDRLRSLLDAIDLKDKSPEGEANLGLFAAYYNRFCVVHAEHAKHEDEVIFKTFNDYFNAHTKVYNDDHAEDHVKMERWRDYANKLLDTDLDDEVRQEALDVLKRDLHPFFDHFLEHLKGEEDNLQPIGRKYFPLELQKQISREVFRITSAENWEVIIPYVVNNVPRHLQRVRYLKVLLWSMPERAQQIGAIVYRNVDAVMWERLRVEVPEMIPRAAPGWRRYY